MSNEKQRKAAKGYEEQWKQRQTLELEKPKQAIRNQTSNERHKSPNGNQVVAGRADNFKTTSKDVTSIKPGFHL